jgi:hypothetical protein
MSDKQPNLTGLEQSVQGIRDNMVHLAGPMAQIAQGGSVASAAWSGMRNVVEASLLGPFAAAVPLALGVVAAIRGIVNATGALRDGMELVSKFEIYTGQFTPLLKSAEAARQRVQELSNFAKTAPFRMDDVVKASKNLEVLTRGAYSGQEALKNIADGAALAGVPMEELSTVWGRLYDGLKSNRGVGEATARLQELGLMSGVTRNKIEMLQESGADAGTIFREAFGAAEGDLKKAAGSTDILAKSLTTLQTTLADTIGNAQRAFAEGSAGAQKMSLQRQAKEIEALTPAAEAAGKAYGFLPSVLEHVKSTLSHVTIETKTFGNIATAVVQAVTVLIGGALVLGVAHAALQIKNLAGSISTIGKGMGNTSWGASLGSTVDSLSAKFEKFRELSKIKAVVTLSGEKNLDEAAKALRATPGSTQAGLVTKSLGARDAVDAANKVDRLAARQRVDNVPASVAQSVLKNMPAGATPSPLEVAKNLKNAPDLKALMGQAGTKTVGELATGIAKYATEATKGAGAGSLFSKAIFEITKSARAAGIALLASAAPILLLSAVMTAASYVYNRFADVWKAQDEAKASATATRSFAESILAAGNAANSAADRLEAYQKLLVEIAKNEEQLAALRKEGTKEISAGVYETKVNSKKADISTLTETKNKFENLGATSSLSVDELKRFKERVALEREIQQASQDRLASALSGEQALAAAIQNTTEWAKKSAAADAERGKKLAVTNSTEYQSALKNSEIPASQQKELAPDEADAKRKKLKELELENRAINETQEAARQKRKTADGTTIKDGRTVGEDYAFDQARSENFQKRDPLEQELKLHDNAIAAKKAKATKRKMEQESGSEELRLDAAISDSSERITSLSKTQADPQSSAKAKKEATEAIEKEKSKKADLENRRALFIQENSPEKVREKYIASKGREIDAAGVFAQQQAAQKTAEIEQERARKDITAKDIYLSAPENKGKSAAEIDKGLRGGGLADQKAAVAQEAIAQKVALMEEAKANLEKVGDVGRKVQTGEISGKDLENAKFEVQKDGKTETRELITDEDRERIKGFRTQMESSPEYRNNQPLMDEEQAKFTKQIAETNLARETKANSGYGNKEEVTQGIAAQRTESINVEQQRKQEVQTAAVGQQDEAKDTRRLQMEQFIAALKSNSYQRAVDEGQARIKAAETELKLAQEKAALKEKPDAELARQEEELKRKIASGQDDGTAAKRLETIQAVRGTDAHALDSDVRSQKSSVDAQKYQAEENMRQKRLEVAQAVRGQQVQAYRMLEGKAQSKDERDYFRKQADTREDKSAYDSAYEQGRGMFGGKGKSAEEVDAQAKEYAQLTTAKGATEREIARQSTPTVTSDLARLGGGSAEAAGGDVPRQQLDRLQRIAGLMEQLVQKAGAQTEADKNPVDPMNY